MLLPTSAKFIKFAEYVRKWEGGQGSDPADSASRYVKPGQVHTNRGVIWPVFQKFASKLGVQPTYDNFLKMTAAQADIIVYQFYLSCKGDKFQDEIGLTLTEFTWGSGLGYTQRAIRKALINQGYNLITPTGTINQVVIDTANKINAKTLYNQLWKNRKAFLESITISRPANKKFLKGWLNRWASFQANFPPSAAVVSGAFFFMLLTSFVIYKNYDKLKF